VPFGYISPNPTVVLATRLKYTAETGDNFSLKKSKCKYIVEKSRTTSI
jgi:hypothetical protein